MSMAVRPARAAHGAPRPILILLAALLAASGILLATARPAAACSCAGFTSMKDYANADTAVFSGTAGLRDARGVPVEIDRWFWGRGAAPVVWLAATSFGDGNSCGTNPPPPGSAWVWVTWLPPDGGDFGTGLCSPAGNLATPEGQAMLDEAVSVFGAIDPLPAQPTAEPTPDAVVDTTPGSVADPTPAPDPAAAARDSAGLTIAAALLAVTIALFGGLALFARRGSRPGRG